MIPGITANPENMRDALRQGFATATDLADYLTRKGLPFRDAHAALSAWRFAAPRNSGVDLAQLSLPELQQFSPLIDDDVFAVLTIEGSLAARSHIGGTAPKQVLAASRAPVAARRWRATSAWRRIGKYELVREIGRGATLYRLSWQRPFHEARGGGQGRLSGHSERSRTRPAVHPPVCQRGGADRQALAPAHRPDLRRRGRRPSLLHRHGICGGRDAGDRLAQRTGCCPSSASSRSFSSARERSILPSGRHHSS
jgi:hypothetical protein